MIDSLQIGSFKKVERANLSLGPINVLVGGNNSGKSCILQGIHFGTALSQARRIAGVEQFPPERLRYCPTDDFLDLRTGGRLTEGASVEFNYDRTVDGILDRVSVTLQRGRNGVVKAQSDGGALLDSISDPKGFSQFTYQVLRVLASEKNIARNLW